MALIKCPECEKEISDQADFCPNCGYTLERKKRRKDYARNGREKTSTGMILNSVATVAWVILFAYIFLVLGGVHAYATKDTYQTTYVNPFNGERTPMYSEESHFIDLDQVNKFKSAGYEIEYVVGESHSTDITSPTNFYIELCCVVLICILGFVIYRMNDSKNRIQIVLPLIYLGATILTMVAFTFTAFLFIMTVLGIPVILFIVQIVAAVKYISGARLTRSEILDS